MMGVRSQRRPENPISLAVADPADRPPWGAALPTLYALEEAHWWTRGMFACTAAILAADGWSGRGAVLDVGCGSGGFCPSWRRVRASALTSPRWR